MSLATTSGRARIAGVSLALVSAAALTACGGGSSNSSSSQSSVPTGVATGTAAPVKASTQVGDTLTFANSAGPGNMNPALGGNGRLGIFVMPAYDSLTTIAPDGTVKPDLATSWQYVGSGNTQFEMTIRQGVTFSNGEPLTAQAVVDSINYFKTAGGPFAKSIAGIGTMTANGDKVSITLSAPNPDLPSIFSTNNMAGAIIAPAGLKNPAQLGATTLGAGPYVLDQANTVAGSTYTYTPNPTYFDKSRQHWKKLVIKVFPDTNSAYQSLQTGQVQIMLADPTTAATLDTSKVQVLASPVQWSGLVFFDRSGQVVPALGKPEVRQAINYAIDKAAIAKALYGPYAQTTSEVQGPGFPGYDASVDKQYSYDVTKAKQLLTQAGYPNGFEMTVLEQKTSATDALLQTISQQLAKVGIKVTIKADPTTPQWIADLQSGKYPVNAGQLNFGPPSSMWSASINGAFNPLHSSDPQLTDLVQQGSAADTKTADATWQKFFAALTDKAWFAPVVRSDVVYFTSKTVSVPPPGQAIVINPVDVAVAG